MGKFSGIGDVDATGDRKPYFLEGNYKVRITQIIDRESRNGDLFVIIEAEILESDNENVRVGSVHSQVIKYNQDMGPINVKRFLLAANGIDPNDKEHQDQVDEDVVEEALSSDQPLAGLVMRLQCSMTTTKAKNTPFTVHTWFPLEVDDQD